MDNPIRLHWLDPRDPEQNFPPSHLAMRDPNGLLAIGGDLSVPRMLRAYRQGIFPWYNPDEPILWWCPDPRAVLHPGRLKVSRSLRKSIARQDYAVTLDHAVADVLNACAGARAKSRGTWLGPDMQQAYCDLHEHGHSHSVEVWRNGALIGGLYGVSTGRVFFGESMFSHASDASKIALYFLCEQLKRWSYELIDCQISSAHLSSLGAEEISRRAFLELLAPAVRLQGQEGRWQLDPDMPHSAAHLPPNLSALQKL